MPHLRKILAFVLLVFAVGACQRQSGVSGVFELVENQPDSALQILNRIEVKSFGYKNHASLDAFFAKFHSRIRQQYIVYTKDLRKDGPVTCLPVYMTGFLGEGTKR